METQRRADGGRARQRRLVIGSLLASPVLLAVAWFAAREAAAPEEREIPGRTGTPAVPAPEPVQESSARGSGADPPDGAADPEPPEADERTQLALFGTAKVTALYAGHDVEGVRVERVDPASFWGEVGVRSGDTVIAHNGAPIDDAAAMIALLNAMERDPVIRLRVRNADGDERTLYYSEPR